MEKGFKRETDQEDDILMLSSPGVDALLEQAHDEELTTAPSSDVAEEVVSVMTAASTCVPCPDVIREIPTVCLSSEPAGIPSPVRIAPGREMRWRIKSQKGCYFVCQGKIIDCFQFMNILSVKTGWFGPEVCNSFGTAPLLDTKNHVLAFSASFPPQMMGSLPRGEAPVMDLSLFFLGEDPTDGRKQFKGYVTTRKGTLCLPVADDGIMMRMRVDVEATVRCLSVQPFLSEMDARFMKACIAALSFYGPLPQYVLMGDVASPSNQSRLRNSGQRQGSHKGQEDRSSGLAGEDRTRQRVKRQAVFSRSTHGHTPGPAPNSTSGGKRRNGME
ncbi:uncharacterized protein [Nothobranchius furzeri]|uniref:uncharacterized protein n=1 Tax=Nothobranchius furzeri TaxID=105023 RepID=UPI003904C584